MKTQVNFCVYITVMWTFKDKSFWRSSVFQLICLVQAFRGRNLPGPMNDAMSMVYLILITTITFAITFPISYFRDQLDKEFIHFVALTVNSICSVLILYGKKCFSIIVSTKKNTRDHFNKKRFEALSSQVGLQTIDQP